VADKILLNAGTSGLQGPSADKMKMTCIRAAGLRYVLGWPGDSSDASEKGSLGHVAAAHYYRRMQARQQGDDPDQWYTPEEAMEKACEDHPKWGKHYGQIRSTFDRYVAHYPNEYKEITVLHVEEIAGVQLFDEVTGSHYHHTRLDLVYLRNSDLTVRICDHKFVGHPNRRHAEEYGRDAQFVFLNILGRTYFGGSFGGCELNLIGVDGKKFARFSQATLPAIPDRIRDLPRSIGWARMAFDFWKQSGVHPTRWPTSTHMHACRNRFAVCAYRNTCDFYRRGDST
jgi:hypothetical protein